MPDDTHDETSELLCRRCTVCDGYTHHWMVDLDEHDPPAYIYVCKHCPAVGLSCETCDGDDDADPDCPACQGEGVIRVEGVRIDDDPTPYVGFMRSRLREMQEHLQINGYPDATEQDALEALAKDCGRQRDGSCTLDGSEECDFECPFRDMEDEDD